MIEPPMKIGQNCKFHDFISSTFGVLGAILTIGLLESIQHLISTIYYNTILMLFHEGRCKIPCVWEPWNYNPSHQTLSCWVDPISVPCRTLIYTINYCDLPIQIYTKHISLTVQVQIQCHFTTQELLQKAMAPEATVWVCKYQVHQLSIE